MLLFGSRNDPKQYHSTQVLTNGLIYEIDVLNVDDGMNNYDLFTEIVRYL